MSSPREVENGRLMREAKRLLTAAASGTRKELLVAFERRSQHQVYRSKHFCVCMLSLSLEGLRCIGMFHLHLCIHVESLFW